MNNTIDNKTPRLKRELGLFDAIAIGLGAVIGAGIFVVSGVAAGIAGPAMLIALVIAAIAATFNGLSSAQLAARFPKAGGTYEYGYEMLHPLAGFSAGWLFLISKLAAGSVVALGFGSYLQMFFPEIDIRLSATIILGILVIANILGIKKAGILNRVIVSITVLSLLYFIVSGTVSFDSNNFTPFLENGIESIAVASGVLFFAFTGYARIATLSEEVREPKKTIPKAIIITLIMSVILYLLVVIITIGAIGTEEMAIGGAPLFKASSVMTWPLINTIIGIAAITSMVGVLLSQILGTSRMFFAMARRGDLPTGLTKLTRKTHVPIYTILFSGLIILIMIWLGELKFITQTASFTILIYYSIANLSAIKLKKEDRFLPKWISYLGLILCIVMAFSLPIRSILFGLILLVVGLIFRFIFRKLTKVD